MTVLDRVQDPQAAGGAFRVGATYPLRPPLGSAVLAWAEETAVASWLAYLPAERRPATRAALEATRARGFAVELAIAQVASVRQVLERLGDYESTAITAGPQVRAVVDELVAALADQQDYLAVDVEPGRDYAVSAVNAPVFDHDGNVTLVIALTGFVTSLTGDDVMTIGGKLAATTSALTSALRGAS